MECHYFFFLSHRGTITCLSISNESKVISQFSPPVLLILRIEHKAEVLKPSIETLCWSLFPWSPLNVYAMFYLSQRVHLFTFGFTDPPAPPSYHYDNPMIRSRLAYSLFSTLITRNQPKLFVTNLTSFVHVKKSDLIFVSHCLYIVEHRLC